MRNNNNDKTLQRNYFSKWRFMIDEYELVKAKKHPKFRFVGDFYRFHHTHRQTFLKYYHRFARSGDEASLLPGTRGPKPKWKKRRACDEIDSWVLNLRRLGNNRYEIYAILQPRLKERTPSPSTIYRILRRYGVNRLNPKMRENRRKIIKRLAGEMGHIDCHHLSKDLIKGEARRRYVVCLLDDCTRVAWAEVVDDIKALTVMFAGLKVINLLNAHYRIRFAEILSDNGSEFASPRAKMTHPFERMLLELGIKHRYTRPYRPQTNGKVERFWRTLNEDLIDGMVFDSVEHFKDELEQYLVYYNDHRPHQAINNKTPKQMNDSCHRISEPIQFPRKVSPAVPTVSFP